MTQPNGGSSRKAGQTLRLRHGDCLEVLADLPEASVGAIVSDPPYGLEFMGESWDAPWVGKAASDFNTIKKGTLGGFSQLPNHSRVNNTRCAQCNRWRFSGTPCTCPQPQFPNARLQAMQLFEGWSVEWASEAYRVLKPEGVIKAFSGTRTFHRVGAALQKVGFTDLHLEAWNYGSGFPKSLNISSALDKAARGTPQGSTKGDPQKRGKGSLPPRKVLAMGGGDGKAPTGLTDEYSAYIPATDAAKLWSGWGTALKPSWEPVLVGRKPA